MHLRNWKLRYIENCRKNIHDWKNVETQNSNTWVDKRSRLFLKFYRALPTATITQSEHWNLHLWLTAWFFRSFARDCQEIIADTSQALHQVQMLKMITEVCKECCEKQPVLKVFYLLTFPLRGSWILWSSFMRVALPHPFSPKRATVVPDSTAMLTDFNI